MIIGDLGQFIVDFAKTIQNNLPLLIREVKGLLEVIGKKVKCSILLRRPLPNKKSGWNSKAWPCSL